MKSYRFYLAFAFLFTVSFMSSKAQVKITDGAVMTLDQNSLLELESTNKGLLIPRIAINNASQAAPLTAPVPPGMLIYSSGGTIPDGFYYWNGTSWKVLPSGLVSIANGGTNSGTALSGSSIIISDGTSIVQGPAGTATTVLHGNAAGAPTYGAVGLTTDVTGVLPVGNGGTALSTLGTANQVLAVNSTATGYAHRTMKFQIGTWGTANLLANQTNLSLLIVAVGGGNLGAAGSKMKMAYDGRILGLNMSASAVNTAGSATFTVYKNSVATSTNIVYTPASPQFQLTTANTTAFAAGDLLDIRVTTTADYWPSKANEYVAWIIIEWIN